MKGGRLCEVRKGAPHPNHHESGDAEMVTTWPPEVPLPRTRLWDEVASRGEGLRNRYVAGVDRVALHFGPSKAAYSLERPSRHSPVR